VLGMAHGQSAEGVRADEIETGLFDRTDGSIVSYNCNYES
jgi:hypothetical protein